MTFPVVAARTTTADPSAALSHSIGLGGPSAGDLLVVFVATSGAGGPYIIDGASGDAWVMVQGVGTGSLRMGVLAKIASGGDALTLLTANSARMASVCYRVTGHGSALAGGSFASASSGSGDPPSASHSGAAQDTLFLAALATVSSVASAEPASYSTLTTASAGTAFMAAAERDLNGTSDDPGTFTNTSQQWIATTVAIPEFAITTPARLTQEAVEAISGTDAAARLTQIAAEAISQVTSAARLTQMAVEMVSENVPDDTVTARPVMFFIAT